MITLRFSLPEQPTSLPPSTTPSRPVPLRIKGPGRPLGDPASTSLAVSVTVGVPSSSPIKTVFDSQIVFPCWNLHPETYTDYVTLILHQKNLRFHCSAAVITSWLQAASVGLRSPVWFQTASFGPKLSVWLQTASLGLKSSVWPQTASFGLTSPVLLRQTRLRCPLTSLLPPSQKKTNTFFPVFFFFLSYHRFVVAGYLAEP